MVSGHVDQRLECHPWTTHVHNHQRDALVLGRLRVRARCKNAVVRTMGVAGPDLHSRYDEVISVRDGARLQRGEVRTGTRLAEALAPNIFTADDSREVSVLLLLRA